MPEPRPEMPPLVRAGLATDPIAQLRGWWELAERRVPLPEAMTLATVDDAGEPDARMVLLKGFDERGLRFFTNHESEKAAQLDGGGRAAVVLYWRELDRQVRARGEIERLSAAESDAYFAGRPRDSQLGAWASPQSRPLGGRRELEHALGQIDARFGEGPIVRPPHWGGYLLRPRAVEFWQGRAGRLHDRFRYTRDGGEWRIERLAP